MSTVYFILQQTMYCMIPLLMVALAGMFSEKGGVQNIALEGLMMTGAFSGVFFIKIIQENTGYSGQWLLVAAVIVAGIVAMAVSLLHAFVSINLSAHQVISGTSINLLIPAITILLAKRTLGVLQVSYQNTFRITEVPILSKIPVIGDIFFKNTYITAYIGFFLLIVASIVIYRTKFGVRLLACGENPHAADSVGINVSKIRYAGVLISGFLAGAGGVAFMVSGSTEYSANIAGYGFLSLAVLVFGQWKPRRILFASFFFGFLKVLASVYTSIPAIRDLGISGYAYKMLPYVATLIVLAITSSKAAAPAALGQPYDKGKR